MSQIARQPLQILVVEEEAWLAILLRDALGWEPHTIEVARDGADACRRAAGDRYDAIVLGVPGPAGLELCRRLRASGSTTPILILNARATVDDVIAGLNAGADDYLAGLADVDELVARVRALARRYRADVTDSTPQAGVSAGA
jgi:two-component system response regulator MprA